MSEFCTSILCADNMYHARRNGLDEFEHITACGMTVNNNQAFDLKGRSAINCPTCLHELLKEQGAREYFRPRRNNTDHYADVLAFHEKFDCYIGDQPHIPPEHTATLRGSLMTEELGELMTALTGRKTIIRIEQGEDVGGPNMVQVADGLADLLYVVYGTAVSCGIDIRPVFAEVHASNMRKEGGATRADGKILKPAGWQPPDVAGALRKQGWNGGQVA